MHSYMSATFVRSCWQCRPHTGLALAVPSARYRCSGCRAAWRNHQEEWQQLLPPHRQQSRRNTEDSPFWKNRSYKTREYNHARNRNLWYNIIISRDSEFHRRFKRMNLLCKVNKSSFQNLINDFEIYLSHWMIFPSLNYTDTLSLIAPSIVVFFMIRTVL